MAEISSGTSPRRIAAAVFSVCLFLPAAQLFAAQTAAEAETENGEELQTQLRNLQLQMERLEALLQQNRPESSAESESSDGDRTRAGMMKRRGMSGARRKGMRMMMMGEREGASEQGMEKGGMDATGPMMMGRMKRPKMSGGGMRSLDSSLPGFPGASHIYHVGATGFFLDHDEHITLTAGQQKQLSRIREQTLLSQATFDRWIEEAEQQLWVLTGSDRPDAAEIRTQVMEIAKLTAQKRLAFIEAVGKAADVLTDEQRKILTGLHSSDRPAGSEGSD